MTNLQRDMWSAADYHKNARFVSDLGAPLIDLLAPQAGEYILDLGCGDGALTETLVARGCRVVGIDGSADMVAAAKRRGIDARCADARTYIAAHPFDAVFSNAALHWIKQPELAIATVWNSLKPGGRFVAELGGEGNVSTLVKAIHQALSNRGIDPLPLNPWFFPSPETYRTLLECAGFHIVTMNLFSRPTPLPGDVSGWLVTFAQPFLSAIPEQDRPSFISEVCQTLEPILRKPDKTWFADYVRLRFHAVKP